MSKRNKRYKQMEQTMSYLLLADGVLFLIFLLSSGLGILWMKVVSALVCIAISSLCLGFLYLAQELLRPRSRWMSVGFASVLVCLLVSLICNYPSPDPLKDASTFVRLISQI